MFVISEGTKSQPATRPVINIASNTIKESACLDFDIRLENNMFFNLNFNFFALEPIAVVKTFFFAVELSINLKIVSP